MSSNARRQPATTRSAAASSARRPARPARTAAHRNTRGEFRRAVPREAYGGETRKAPPRTTRGEARPSKPAGLALCLTLLATLIAGSCVGRVHASSRAEATRASGVALAAPGGTPRAGKSAAARPSDAPRPAPLLKLSPSPTPSAAPTGAKTVTIDRADGEWDSWAMLNRATGDIVTGGDSGTNSTESMIKAWIAADYLNGLGGAQPGTADLDLMRRMIRDSDNDAAETLYLRRGNDAVINRLISTCGLTDTTVHHGWWSLTQISARDAARMGDCIADGKATNPRWTAWLLNEMRQVEGTGRFGIVEERPGVAIKNGWTDWGGYWHVNCLAVTDGWALSVLTRYPDGLGLGHGAAVCRSVTRQLAP